MSAISVTMNGLAEVDRALAELERVADLAELEQDVEAAAAVIVESARSRVKSSRIRAAITVFGTERTRDTVETAAGVPAGVNSAAHANLVELGTGPRMQKTTGRRTGSMPADPFLRPAFDTEKSRVLDAIGDRVKSRLNRLTSG